MEDGGVIVSVIGNVLPLNVGGERVGGASELSSIVSNVSPESMTPTNHGPTEYTFIFTNSCFMDHRF